MNKMLERPMRIPIGYVDATFGVTASSIIAAPNA